jgi:hypothetical protein
MFYNVETDVIDYVAKLIKGKTLVLFSGSWRFNFDATYLELKMVQHCDLNFHHNTLFVEPQTPAVLNLVLKSHGANTIVVLHSDYWMAHRPVEQVVHHMDQLLKNSAPGAQVICTVPLIHLNFNRLVMSYQDLGFELVADSAVIVRK